MSELLERLRRRSVSVGPYRQAPLNPDGPEAADRIEQLEAALHGARDAIASLDADALGTNWQGNPEVPGGVYSWPIRDEVLHYIDAALRSRQSTQDQS